MTSKRNLLKSAALVGAITATGAVATTTAHADTTPTSQPAAQSDTSSTTAQDQLNSLKQTQTKEENDLAAKNAAQYQKYQAAVEPQIKSAQSQLANQQVSQSAQDAAKLQSVQTQYQSQANVATKQENQRYDNAVEVENTQYTGAVSTQQTANQKVLKDASAHIVTPEQQAQQKQVAKTYYDNQVKQAKEKKISDINKEKAVHDNQSANLQSQISQKQSAASKAHDAQLKSATDAVNDAQNKVNIDTQAKNQAQKDFDNAKNTLTRVQNILDYNSKNNFVPKGIIKGDRHGADFRVIWNQNDLEKLGNDKRLVIYINGKGQKCAYKLDPIKQEWGYYVLDNNGQVTNQRLNDDDDPDEFDITNDELTELTIWSANVLNGIRKQVGSVPVHVSQESLAAVKDAMQQYIDGNPSVNGVLQKSPFRHDSSIYSNVGAKYSLPNFVSSISNYLPGSEDGTMGALKGSILEQLDEFISDRDNVTQGNYGHRYHLLGLNSWDYENEGTPYFGIGAEDGCFHVFVSTNGYNQHDIPLTNDTGKLQQAVNAAQTSYNSAKAYTDKTASQLSTDTQTLKTAQNTLAQVKATKVTDSPEVTQLKQLNADYQAKLNSIDNNYKSLEQKLLDQYNQKLADIAKEPTSIDALKKSLDQKLTDLKSQHDSNLDQLAKDHQAKLDAIKANAEKQLADLKQQLADKNKKANQPLIDKITKLQSELANSKAKLDQQLTDLKTKHQAEYDAMVAKLAPKQTKNAVIKGNSDYYTTANGQVVNLKPGNGKTTVNNISTTNSSLATFTPATPTNTYPTREEYKQSQLPQTGNSNSIAIVALGVLSSMFGLGLVAKKENI
ncbi:SEC10/PgrA surface exclusion domain-containing protein [Lactobacillus reuteri]|nr:SEC10/PgrA surface exclusion domain-containing protein [Limosilactobacillus reuteri]